MSMVPRGKARLLALRASVAELGFDGRNGVLVRATGVFPLSYEEMEQLDSQTMRAGLASFVLVALILILGLGSLRLVAASLLTLLAGLAITASFAALAIGHLNLISVAFAVLFLLLYPALLPLHLVTQSPLACASALAHSLLLLSNL